MRRIILYGGTSITFGDICMKVILGAMDPLSSLGGFVHEIFQLGQVILFKDSKPNMIP